MVAQKSTDMTSKPQRMLSVSAATPSKPVIIPTRPQSSKSERVPRPTRSRSDEKVDIHDSNSIPPSMAALLAITNIPHPKGQSIRHKGFGRRTEIENFSADEYRHTLSSSSPRSWSILQSPPDTESDIDDSSGDTETDHSSLTSNSTVAPLSSFRSLSFDSMRSLEMELEFESSFSSSPPNPGNRYKPRPRKEKRPSPAIPVANDTEHPLSTTLYPDHADPMPALSPIPETIDSDPLFLTMDEIPASSFKSNLTASLRLLKSAARSLSAPSQYPNPATVSPAVIASAQHKSVISDASKDKLARVEEPRRQSFHLSRNIDALPFYLSNQLPAPRTKSSIQLQPYFASPLSTLSATAPPIFLPAANPPLPPPSEDFGQRDRQQRENSNFLRVVVLEMNMRRAGKLNGDGRARVWLAARAEKAAEAKDVVSEGGQGIADGNRGTGAVVLDGEIGEAQEVGLDEERLERVSCAKERENLYPRVSILRRGKCVPERWIATTL
ncbi:MAG: hypothetical protein MMC23_006864 [Stictis urceolatum]|nr:hypothetical protein [Stictis urceolata]